VHPHLEAGDQVAQALYFNAQSPFRFLDILGTEERGERQNHGPSDGNEECHYEERSMQEGFDLEGLMRIVAGLPLLPSGEPTNRRDGASTQDLHTV
jgi:hypothetical protein